MEFMLKAEKKLKAFSLFGNKKEEALELYQKGAVRAAADMRTYTNTYTPVLHAAALPVQTHISPRTRFASSRRRSGRRLAKRA